MFSYREMSSCVKTLLLTFIVSSNLLIISSSIAGVIYLPVHRSIKNQPITTLEVVALVKSKHKGRILSVKKHAAYRNPDCHYVKLLENNGEFQLIKVGCRKKK